MMDIAARVNFLFKSMKIGLLPQSSGSWFLSFCTSVLLLVVGSAQGQSPNQNAIDPERPLVSDKSGPLRVDVDLVLLPVTVTDPMNHSVTSLKKEDFAIYEGNQQQEIRYFSTEDTPISVAILLDVSKSMSDKIETERA